jgi:hypothetical protein
MVTNPDDARLPSGWTEEPALRLVAVLLGAGDPNAARFFAARTLVNPSIARHDWVREKCCRALAKSPSLWPLVLRMLEHDKRVGDPVLLDCVRMICNDKEAARKLGDRIVNEHLPISERVLMLSCFQFKKDDRLKRFAFDCWTKGDEYECASVAESYIRVVGTQDDLPAMEALAATKTERDREDVDSLIRSIRMRLLLDRYLSTIARPASKPATAPVGEGYRNGSRRIGK